MLMVFLRWVIRPFGSFKIDPVSELEVQKLVGQFQNWTPVLWTASKLGAPIGTVLIWGP